MSASRDIRDSGARVGLVIACQSGSEKAWAELCDQYATRVYKWSVLLGLRPSDAEDAAQEVLVVALKKIGTCDSDAVLTTWLYQITRRVVANVRRSAWLTRVFATEQPIEPAFEHTHDFNGRDREIAVRKCLAKMKRGQAEILLLMDLEGFTRNETAQILDIRPGTVASRLRLARVAFRKLWKEHGAPALDPNEMWRAHERA